MAQLNTALDTCWTQRQCVGVPAGGKTVPEQGVILQTTHRCSSSTSKAAECIHPSNETHLSRSSPSFAITASTTLVLFGGMFTTSRLGTTRSTGAVTRTATITSAGCKSVMETSRSKPRAGSWLKAVSERSADTNTEARCMPCFKPVALMLICSSPLPCDVADDAVNHGLEESSRTYQRT